MAGEEFLMQLLPGLLDKKGRSSGLSYNEAAGQRKSYRENRKRDVGDPGENIAQFGVIEEGGNVVLDIVNTILKYRAAKEQEKEYKRQVSREEAKEDLQSFYDIDRKRKDRERKMKLSNALSGYLGRTG
jgi:hypothetical protein